MSLEAVCVVVMAKCPAPGRVKTRLGPALTPSQAAAVHRIFLRHVIGRLSRMRPAELVVCYDPPECGPQMRALVEPIADVSYWPQAAGDLGARIANAASRAAELHRRVLFLGVDSPDVPDGHLHRAAALTGEAPVCLGPTEDGGYWFLGLSGTVDAGALLEGVRWSSGHEARQTLQHAEALGYAAAVGDRWDDVDRPEDLARLLVRLIGSGRSDEAALFRQLRSITPEGMLPRGVQS